MKINRHLILLFFLFSGITTFSQTNIEKIILEINNNLKTYAADPKLTKVYLNRNEKILDILDYQIPLNYSTVFFKNESRIYDGVEIVGNISFRCEEDCIIDQNNNSIVGVAFAFKSKEGAYKFIELVYKLKQELEK